MIRLDGAVENAVGLGLADVIADVVDTGGTLRKAGLEPVGDVVLTSSAVLVRRSGAPGNGPVAQLVRRLQGVLVARRYVMLAYDVRADQLDVAVALTPGHRVADDLAAAPGGVGRGAGHGAAHRGTQDHGRAVRHGRAGDPRHRHPRLPAVIRPWSRRQPEHLPGDVLARRLAPRPAPRARVRRKDRQ